MTSKWTLSCRKIFLLAISSPWSVFFFELLQDPSCTQHWSCSCLEEWLCGKYEFPLPPFQRSVVWEGREGDRGKKEKLCKCKPSLLSSSVNDFECFGWKKKLKIDCNFQFSIFLSHATGCNIVGKAIGHFHIFMIKSNENQKLTSIFNFWF